MRGPYRALTGQTNDFRTFYSGTVSWVEGNNPYNQKNLDLTLSQEGGNSRPDYQQITTPLLFLIISPIALFNWQNARILWLIINF